MNDPETWAPYEVALEHAQRRLLPGIGFIVTRQDPYVGIDLDDCRDRATGSVAPWAQEIIDRFASYTEITPSEEGVRIWIQTEGGLLPDESGGRRQGLVEIYAVDRFFTITGQRVGDTAAIAERTAPLKAFCAEYFGTNPAQAPPRLEIQSALLENDDDILMRAARARNGHTFVCLFEYGDIAAYDLDDSRADLALVSHLAFWTQDPGQLDRLFRRSALYRDKWERTDYRERTISKALANRHARHSSSKSTRGVRGCLGPARAGRIHLG